MAALGKQQVVNKGNKCHVPTSLKQIMEFAIKAILRKTNNDYVVKYVTGKMQTPVSTCKMKDIFFLSLHERLPETFQSAGWEHRT